MTSLSLSFSLSDSIGEVNVYKTSAYRGDKICSVSGNFSKSDVININVIDHLIFLFSADVAVFVEFLTEYGELSMLSFQRLSGDVELYIYREQRCKPAP